MRYDLLRNEKIMRDLENAAFKPILHRYVDSGNIILQDETIHLALET